MIILTIVYKLLINFSQSLFTNKIYNSIVHLIVFTSFSLLNKIKNHSNGYQSDSFKINVSLYYFSLILTIFVINKLKITKAILLIQVFISKLYNNKIIPEAPIKT